MAETRNRNLKQLVRRTVATCLATAVCASTALASNGSGPTYGWIEMARLFPQGPHVKAKLDSGALTSSMHGENIERFQRDGQEWVRFSVTLEDQRNGQTVSNMFERPVQRNVIIRGAGGEERRPVILMQLCIGNTVYEEQFNIQDRSDMLYPVLIGRRTIQHMGLIDVTRTFLSKPTCEEQIALWQD